MYRHLSRTSESTCSSIRSRVLASKLSRCCVITSSLALSATFSEPDVELVPELRKRSIPVLHLEVQILGWPLDFRVVTVTSSELLALAVGDVLPLRHPVANPLSVLADGVQVAAAVPGSHGQHLACQIVSI